MRGTRRGRNNGFVKVNIKLCNKVILVEEVSGKCKGLLPRRKLPKYIIVKDMSGVVKGSHG